MLRFTTQKTISAHTRLGNYVGNLSSSTTVTTGPTTCYLRPLSETESSANGYLFGLAFNAIFENGADIKQQDKITIEGIQYLVKGVVNHDRGFGTKYVKALITKPED